MVSYIQFINFIFPWSLKMKIMFFVKWEVLTTVYMKIPVFWMWCHTHISGRKVLMMWKNSIFILKKEQEDPSKVGIILPDYTMSHPKI
jgi:hypothetical protein